MKRKPTVIASVERLMDRAKVRRGNRERQYAPARRQEAEHENAESIAKFVMRLRV
jgi:hypothetical protein